MYRCTLCIGVQYNTRVVDLELFYQSVHCEA